MFIILLIIAISVANCLEPVADDKIDDKIDDEIKKVISKYLDKIPDIEPQYVIHEGLSKVISRYFKGKVSTFPLYKISLKIDRKPVKIPWSLADPAQLRNPAFTSLKEKAKKGRTYNYVSTKKSNKTT